MGFWDNKKVLVTGGAGFVGSHLVEELLRRAPKAKVTVADRLDPGRRENLAAVKNGVKLATSDLLDFDACRRLCKGQDVVLNLAARVGGVGFNAKHHGTMFRDNMILASNVLEAARLADVERFLVVSSACVYPRFCTVPTPESEGFKDWPEESNEGYGWAKRMAEFQAMAYHKEFGMRIAVARPYNCYGPRDHFDPKTSHVIAALIKRVEDGENPLKVWGDGTQTRAFLYVEDFARGLLEVAERYAVCDPVNLGTTEEVSIARLSELVLRATGSKAKVEFDPSKPAGQPRRNCDSSKAKEKAGFEPKIGLEEGLRRTVEWYRRGKGEETVKRSLILLTFNEIEALPKIFHKIPFDAAEDVLAVDGGSKDGTVEFFKSKGIRVAVQERRGRGVAFRLGAAEAKGEQLVYFSPDGNEDPADIPRLFAALEEGWDMAIASRMMAGAVNEEDIHWFRPRKWVNQLFGLAANLLWNRGRPFVTDTINGYRGVTKRAMEFMRTDEDGFPIEYQMSIRAMKLGLKIHELPTREGQRLGGQSTASSLPTGIKFLRRLWGEIKTGHHFVLDDPQNR